MIIFAGAAILTGFLAIRAGTRRFAVLPVATTLAVTVAGLAHVLAMPEPSLPAEALPWDLARGLAWTGIAIYSVATVFLGLLGLPVIDLRPVGIQILSSVAAAWVLGGLAWVATKIWYAI